MRTPRQEDALARIEAGGIPVEAEQRLKALSVDGAPFTSGLSVKEFALLRGLGPAPLAQVMGASVVRTGWQYLPALPPGQVVLNAYPYARMNTMVGANALSEASPQQVRNYTWHTEVVCELDTRTNAWNLARRRALDRLAEEACRWGPTPWSACTCSTAITTSGGSTIEYVVSGTAVRLPDSTRDALAGAHRRVGPGLLAARQGRA